VAGTERRRTDRRGDTRPFLGVERRESPDRRGTPAGAALPSARHVAENAAALGVLFAQLEARVRTASDRESVERALASAWPEIEERLGRIRP
jgi:hypothetical protein